MQLEEKTKTKMWVVCDLSLENFYYRLLVWIEYKFVLEEITLCPPAVCPKNTLLTRDLKINTLPAWG